MAEVDAVVEPCTEPSVGREPAALADQHAGVGQCPFGRRGFLLGMAGVAATALAGCGSDEPDDGAGRPAAPDGAADGPGSPGTSAGSQSAGPDATPHQVPPQALTLATHVPLGGGVVVEQGKVLVVQPTPGVYKAFDARCPHNGVPVNPPDTTGVVTCPRHKAQFNGADGVILRGPAKRSLTGIPIKMAGAYIVRA
ncbi:MAG TPA: Rieske 2Fe-2S domain-containing protein [Pilimelia sp.]|nr:Rieske 2Fe-2S domain-containing protein [Pilimelia sp.]